jgi:hypothetical protein
MTPVSVIVISADSVGGTFRFSSHLQAGNNRNAVKMPITMGAMMLFAYTMNATPAKHSNTMHVVLMSRSVPI